MYYLGLDIGGSKVRGVLWDGRRILASLESKTSRKKASFIRLIHSLVARLSSKARGPITGIGIGAAGVIQQTHINFSPNIPYLKNFEFKKLISLSPLRLDNDARAFCRAEARLGAGRWARRILAITIGTGIGRAYAEKGRVCIIKKFEYPELWEKSYQRLRDNSDTQSLAVFLGKKLAIISRRYRPDVIVLGGGVLGRPNFSKQLKTELRVQRVKAVIRRGRLSQNAVAIGAALLFATSKSGK